jgi:hypothetical protein
MMFREIFIGYFENHAKYEVLSEKKLLTLNQDVVPRMVSTVPLKELMKISFKFQVSMTTSDDNFYWCKIFRLPRMSRKHHMIRVSVTLAY